MADSEMVERVAKALYRQSRIEEWHRDPNHIATAGVDAETYAGWFPWDNLGSARAQWRERAEVAIAAMEIPEINIDTEGDGPTTCRITYRGALMFDGVERSVLLRRTDA